MRFQRNTPSLFTMAENVIKAATDSQPLTVEAIDNHVYFYAEVNADRCLAAIRAIRDTDNRLRNERISRNIPPEISPTPIWLHIYSGGGDLFAGFAFADQLQQIETPVYSIVEGMCASAATLISLACNRRYTLPNSFFLIHQLSSVMWGKHEEFEDELHMQNMAMDRLVEFYSRRTKITADEIRDMMKRETWMNADQALERGFVDKIVK